MGCDVCYTNHAEADQDDMDALLTLLGAAGCTFIMGVPGADDVMLNYQSTSFHDALYVRRALGKRPAPEFEAWLARGWGCSTPTGAGSSDRASAHSPMPGASQRGRTPLRRTRRSSPAQLPRARLWDRLRRFTPARIGIEPTGVSQPTGALLEFQWDHAQARDAVDSALDVEALPPELRELGLETVRLHSEAADAAGVSPAARPGPPPRSRLLRGARALPQGWDVVFVIADGLSADRRQPPRGCRCWGQSFRRSAAGDWRIGPVAAGGAGPGRRRGRRRGPSGRGNGRGADRGASRPQLARLARGFI